MPRATVDRLDAGQRPMGGAALGGRRRLVDGRAEQRMRKLDAAVDADDARLLRLVESVEVEPEEAERAPDRLHFPRVARRDDEQRASCLGAEALDPADECAGHARGGGKLV